MVGVNDLHVQTIAAIPGVLKSIERLARRADLRSEAHVGAGLIKLKLVEKVR